MPPPAFLHTPLPSAFLRLPHGVPQSHPHTRPHRPGPPPVKPPSTHPRPRPRVAAWLSSHDDALVIASAIASSPTTPLTVRGSLSCILPILSRSHVTVLHLHLHVATPSVLLRLRLHSLTPIIVHPLSSLSSSPSPALPPLFLAPVLLPVALIQHRPDIAPRFFDTPSTSDALFIPRDVPDPRSPTERLIAWLTAVYLPQGYPHTTTPDYISFTKFRTLQNLASAIMQVISTEALLFGLGLGKQVAAGAAATSWVLKDGASYFAKITYGSIFGSRFDDDPKSWRIAADVVEDIGGAIEILTPLFPRAYFLPLASLAVCLRGMSLMTGTATRHVVYRSLAANGAQNTGDIATKGESQGVTMKMLGLALGIVVSSRIGQRYYSLLAAYSFLAVGHIAANVRSVQCVQFSFFNKQRVALAIHDHLKSGHVPTPYDVSHREKIIIPPWRGYQPNVRIGATVSHAKLTPAALEQAITLCRGERFLLVPHSNPSKIDILLHVQASSRDALRAYYTVSQYLASGGKSRKDLQDSLGVMRKSMPSFERSSQKAGWDMRHMLLTDGRARVTW